MHGSRRMGTHRVSSGVRLFFRPAAHGSGVRSLRTDATRVRDRRKQPDADQSQLRLQQGLLAARADDLREPGPVEGGPSLRPGLPSVVAAGGKEGQRELLGEAVDFQNAVLHACRIPETGPISGSPECVAAEYERQRSIWLSRLNGPASEEASRPIEQQIALQARLQKLGFLPAAVAIDGVYGEATRSSILAWQGVNRRPQTGFLDDADATSLAGKQETEATPATQSPSPGQGVPADGSALEAAAAAPGPAGFDILGMKLGMSVEKFRPRSRRIIPSSIYLWTNS